MTDPPPQRTGESGEAALREGLAALAALVADDRDLGDVLASIATCAAGAVPGADGAGIVLLHPEHPQHPEGPGPRVAAVAASHLVVADLDHLQHDVLGEGPSLTAAALGRTVLCGSLGGEVRWPRFGPRAGRLGVHSALAVPLVLPARGGGREVGVGHGVGHGVGAIVLYAHAKHAFDEGAARLGERFAAPAAVAAHNAQALDSARRLTVQLQAALSTRAVIDQAVGLLRGRTGASAEDALARLRALSQGEHTRLAVVAQHLVDEAARRARARHDGP